MASQIIFGKNFQLDGRPIGVCGLGSMGKQLICDFVT
jgi:hypothetical protein